MDQEDRGIRFNLLFIIILKFGLEEQIIQLVILMNLLRNFK